MKRVLKLSLMLSVCFLEIVHADNFATIPASLTNAQKEEVAAQVHTIIRKDRIRLVAQASVIAGTIGACFLFKDYFFSKESDSANIFIKLANPEDKKSIKILNLVLWGVQYKVGELMGSFVIRNILPSITPGQWDFTLIEFLEKHTHLREMFDQVYAQANDLLYQNDTELRMQLVESLKIKVETLVENINCIDGFVLLKINELDKENKFNEKSRLVREYAVFEYSRKSFIEKLIASIENVTIVTENTDFQNKVYDIIKVMQRGSNSVHVSIQALSSY